MKIEKKFTEVKLNYQAKALLTILIKEAKDIINSHPLGSSVGELELNDLFDGWIKANDLKLNEVKKEDGVYKLKI